MRRITVAVTVAAIATLLAGCGGAGAGPLAAGSARQHFGSPVRPGQTSAIAIVLRRVDTPVVLLGVRPLHPEDAHGLKLRYAATTGFGLQLGGQRGWNVRKWQLRPVAGFVIPAHHYGGVVVGASSNEHGLHEIRDFVVDYRIGNTRYSAPMGTGFGLCVGPFLPYPEGCTSRSRG
jgi:hypothetical protein